MPDLKDITVFGEGCFWCTEAVFGELKGVVSVMPGYAGGLSAHSINSGQASSPQAAPTYEEVSSGKTGHAEVIKITYNPEQITYNDLLTVFFATHDPTTLNRQGNDVGTQYRSIILYMTDGQKSEAEKFIEKLNESGQKVVTEIKPLEQFYEAEDYHKKYYENNSSAPYCQLVINPKLEKLEEKFNKLLKKPNQ